MVSRDVFYEVVCGIDTTGESLYAARQAARLVADDGRLVFVGVADIAKAGLVYMSAGAVIESLAAETKAALERARTIAHDVGSIETEWLIGLPPRDLLGEAKRLDATLIVVGTHGRSRPLGALTGSVATTAVHECFCSVLIARPTAEPARFPRSIVCGVDGSKQATDAAGVATALASRFDASIKFVVAEDDANADIDLARRSAVDGAELEVSPEKPVEALVAASETSDLLVIGTRELHGARSIASVSERVAHGAACSVLIVH